MNLPLAAGLPISEVVVERLGWVLVHSLWQFTLVALLATGLVRAMHRSSAAARYGLLVIALTISVCMPVTTLLLQRTDAITSPPNPSIPADAVNAAVARVPDFAPSGIRQEPVAHISPAIPTTEVAASETMVSPLPHSQADKARQTSWSAQADVLLRPWLEWIVVGWCLGVVLCSMRPLLGWRTLRRLQRVGVLPVSAEVQLTMQRMAQRLEVRRAVRVLHSTIAQVPVVVGYLRPVILLPLSLMTNIPASQLEAILAHELAHIRRHDFIVNLLQTLIETLFFYHPAVWWLSRQIRVEREHCCDDLVVGLLDNRVEYGRALVAVAALRGHGTLLAPSAADGSLLSRIRRIVGLKADGAADSPWTFAVLLSCCFGAILATALLSFQLLAAMETKYPFRVILPDGVTVELLGISADGTDPSHWWAPDGTALKSQPLTSSKIKSNPDWKKDQRRFEVRSTGAERVSWFFPGDGQYQASGTESHPPERRREHDIRPSPLPSLEPVTIFCGVGEDTFGPWATVDRTGKQRDISMVPSSLAPFYSLIVPLGIETANRKIEIKLKDLGFTNARRLASIEWAAVLKDGTRKSEVGPHCIFGPPPDDSELPIADVDHFEFRVRTHRYWVTYENVAVQPGQKTDVKISVSTPPPPAPDRYVAVLPTGVKVEFAGMTKNAGPAKDGWRPDGSPMQTAAEWPIHSYLFGGNIHSSGNPDNRPIDANAYDFLFTFEGLRRQPSLEFELPVQGRSYPLLPLHEPYRLRVSSHLYSEAENLAHGFRSPYQAVVYLSDEPWGKWQQLSVTGELLNSDKENDLYRTSYSLFSFVRVAPDRNNQGQTVLVMRSPVNYRREYALELRGFDTNGKEVWVADRSHSGVPDPADYMECDWGTMVPLPTGTKLARYEFRLRPYRHRVTFKNISLSPSKSTDVSTQVEPVKLKKQVLLPPRLTTLDEAAILHEKLKNVLPNSWTMQRQGLAFEFRGPRGTTHNEEARITLWFSDHSADSPTLDKRDPKLPQIGSWGPTRIGQTLFVRNRAAEELWPLFLDDLYWLMPVEHVVLAGIIDVDERIDDPHSMMEVMFNAGTRIDVKFNEQGQRICYMEYEPFFEKVGKYGVAKETGLVVIGRVPDPSTAKTEQEKAIALRFQEQLNLIKEGARKHGIRMISLQEYVQRLLQMKKEGRANPLPAVKDGNRMQVPQFSEVLDRQSSASKSSASDKVASVEGSVQPPSGVVEYRGTVLDHRRRPLAGATVALSVVTSDRSGWEHQQKTVKTAVSDAKGAFRLSALPAEISQQDPTAKVCLWAWTSDIATSGFTLLPMREEVSPPYEMVLLQPEPTPELVELVDSERRALKGTIQRVLFSMGLELILPDELLKQVLKSREVDGSFQLNGFPRDYGDDSHWRSVWIQVEGRGLQHFMWNPRESDPKPMRLISRAPAIIRGRLTTTSGKLPPELLKSAEIKLNSYDQEPKMSNLFSTSRATVRCDSEGRFEVRTLAPGKLGAVDIRSESLQGWKWLMPQVDGQDIQLAAATPLDLEIPFVRTRTVRGQFVTTTGEPLHNVSVDVLHGQYRRKRNADMSVMTSGGFRDVITTDASGNFSLEVVPGLISVSRRLQMDHIITIKANWPQDLEILREYGDLQVDAGETPLTLPALEIPVTTGRIIDQNDRAVKGTVMATDGQSNEFTGLAYSKRDGTFRLETMVEPKTFTVLPLDFLDSTRYPPTETIVVQRDPLVLRVQPATSVEGVLNSVPDSDGVMLVDQRAIATTVSTKYIFENDVGEQSVTKRELQPGVRVRCELTDKTVVDQGQIQLWMRQFFPDSPPRPLCTAATVTVLRAKTKETTRNDNPPILPNEPPAGVPKEVPARPNASKPVPKEDFSKPIDCEVVDAVTGKLITGATVQFRFLKVRRELGEGKYPFPKLEFRNVGRFQFHLPQGLESPLDYYLERTVEHPDYVRGGTSMMGLLTVLKGEKDYSSDFLRIVKLTPGKIVTGKVLDLNGGPASGVQVAADSERHGWETLWRYQTTTDPSGRYRLVIPENHGRDRLYVMPNHAAAVSRAISASFGEQPVFQLRNGTRLHGRVLDAENRGVANVLIRANGGPRIPWRYTFTDIDGGYSLPPCQYGEYTVEVVDLGRAGDSTQFGAMLPAAYLSQKVSLPKTAPIEQTLDFHAVDSVRVTARYSNGDGTPVIDVPLVIYGRIKETYWSGKLRAVSDQPGTYAGYVPRGLCFPQISKEESRGGSYFLRVTREVKGSDEAPLWHVPSLDQDDDSMRVQRFKSATVTLRMFLDGQTYKHQGLSSLIEPTFANPDAAREWGADQVSSMGITLFADGGRQMVLHPNLDVKLTSEGSEFKPWTETIRLKEGEQRTIEVQLQSNAPAAKDAVNVKPPEPTAASHSDSKDAAELLVSMISEPNLATLKKLLPPVDTLHLEPMELLDEGRFRRKPLGIKARLVGTGSEQFAIVLARVRRIEELVPIEEDPQLMSDCAFVFDLKGQLMATIGGGRNGSREDVDIVCLGPREDWFVRTMAFEKRVPFEHRTEFYRLANPMVKSLRYLHYANSNSWSQGPEKIVRWGRLSFDFPRVADKLNFETAGLTKAGVPVAPQITWDGDRNRFFGAVSQSVKGKLLFEVDTAWSGDFEPLNPQPNQLITIGGIYDYDCWHAWETVVPDQVEASAILTIPQATGAPQIIRKKLPKGRSLLALQVKPVADAQSIDLVVLVAKEKQALKVPHQMGTSFSNEPPIVQVIGPGQSARLCSRLLKSSNELLTFDVELGAGAQSKP